MPAPVSGQLEAFGGGVVRYLTNTPNGGTVECWLRYPPGDERFGANDMLVTVRDGSMLSIGLRVIRVGWIDGICRQPSVQPIVHGPRLVDGETLEEMRAAATARDAHGTSLTDIEADDVFELVAPSTANGGRSYGDDFYRSIAAGYWRFVTDGQPPTAAIAEHLDVPLTTAKRWVKEARRRGHLPPGQQGKAG
jgi:hypothetical protein